MGPVRGSDAVTDARAGTGTERVLVSVPWTWAFGEPPEPGDARRTTVLPRRVDWGRGRWAALGGLLADAGRVAVAARHHDVVVLATAGVEAALTSRLVKALRRRVRVVVLDVLVPRRELPPWVARRVFSRVDAFLVIRRGDAAMLARRFGVPDARCRFVAWPVPARTSSLPHEAATLPGGRRAASDAEPLLDREGRPLPPRYVYSAGWAHRDWPTLLAALGRTDVVAVLAPGHDLEVPPALRERVHVVGMPPPDVGRRLTAAAAVVAVVVHDTDLPSGPLVLLDALAAGRAVVASDVNGTRDYVHDAVTALVVPPGDADALAAALTRLWDDEGLAARLGTAAARYVTDRLGTAAFWAEVLRPQPRPGRGSSPTLS